MVKYTRFVDRRGNTHPMVELSQSENDKYTFSFGLSKARLIVKHFEEIKAFVEALTPPVTITTSDESHKSAH